MSSSIAWRSSRARTRARRSPLAITAAGAFVAFLDVTIVNVALPDIGRSLNASSVTDLSWTITAYGAVFAALLTPAGRLADALGQQRVLRAGLALFVVASSAAAAAPSLAYLVGARVVQGAAAALVTPASFGLLLRETPEPDRARAVGVWGAAAAMSALFGPSLGGLLTELADWRVLFAVNVPVGVALWLAVGRPSPGDPSRQPLPDGLGVALVTVSIVLLTIGTTKGSAPALLAGGAGLVLAVVRSGRVEAPAIDVGLLADRSFALANVVSLVFALAVFAWLLAGPLFAAQVWGYGPLTAALSVAPCAISAGLASVAVGRLSVEARHRWILAGALLFAAVSGWLAVGLGDDPSFLGLWLPAGLLSGVAIGSALASLSAAVADALPADSFAAGAGLNMTARQLGGSLGVALMAALLASPDHAADFTPVWLAGAAASLIGAVGALGLLRPGTI